MNKIILLSGIIFCIIFNTKAQHVMRFQSSYLDQHKDFTLPLKAVCWFKDEGKQLMIIDSIIGNSLMYSHKQDASTALVHHVDDLEKLRVYRQFNHVRDGVLIGLYGIDLLFVGGGFAIMALSDSAPPEANAAGLGLVAIMAGVITTGVTLVYETLTKNTYRTNSFYIQGFDSRTWHQQ